MKNFIYFLVFCFVCLTISYAQTPDANGIVYVKKGATGNGSSWSNATGELADALKAAKEATAGTVKQIWVAGGTYYPLYAADFASTDNRDKSFVLVKDVQIYGGFAGWEAALADRRLTLSVNKTILSGDLGTADDYSDNCYHVMIAAGGVGTALVDGITLMKGSTTTGSSSNVLTVNGQGIPRITGGGIMMYGAAPAINNTTICSNKAIAGAGLYIGFGSSPVITNCIISGNYANVSGSGNGGASFIYNSSPSFINVVIAGNNAATLGGALMVSGANPVFYNSVIYGNGTAQPMNVISGSYNLYYSMVQGGAANTANHNLADTDPYFVNAPSYTTAPFTGGDYALQSASPVINMGNNNLYTGLNAASGDISGNPRVFNYAGGGTIDMGATETQDVNGAGIIYVKKGSTGSGYSWADAMGEPADALYAAKAFNTQAAGKVKQVWVAAGTYYPLYQMDGGNTNSRLKSFSLLSDVKIYGHFAGTETSIGDRDLTSATYTSTLSGDLGVAGTASDNAYHVVTGINGLGTAILDGFTISNGYADYLVSTNVGGTGVWNHWGGGIHLTNGASPYCSNLTIQNNYSGDAGGGVMVYNGSSPTFENVNFLANTSLKGGGVSVFSSSLTTINCTISGNGGSSGGGIFGYGTSYLTIKNTVINSNTASGGAAVYAGTGANVIANKVTVSGNIASVNGGGFFLSTGSHNLTDVLISGNTAGYYGAALYNTGNSYKLTNVTIAGNRDGATGGVVYNDGSVNETINNSVISNNSAGIYNTGTTTSAITYSMIQGISANSSTHMLAPASPGFVNAPAYTTAPSTGGDYSLSAGSPLADGGSNTLYAGLTSLSTDRAGAARVTAFASGGVIDIGAYESAMLPQSITVSNMGKTYGSADFAPGFTATSGLTVSYASADNAIAEAYQDASDGNSWKIKIRKAGTVQITASQSGNSTYAGAPAQTFTLTIAKASLQVTARDSSKVYDASAFTGGNGVTYSGFVNGDDSSSLGGTLSFSGTALNAVHAGTGYTIVPSGYSSANYTFTYINGSLTITKAPLTVTARDTAKTYDGVAFTGNAGVSVTGWVNNETAALLSGTLSFSGTAQGAVNAGNNYSLIPAGYTAADYDITYVSGKLVINQKALTITAKDSVAVYNGNAFAGGNGITCNGFVNNEDPAQALTGAVTYSGNSQGAIAVNSYTIIPGGLAAANYSITYQNGTLTVNKAPLTVTAKDSARVYNGLAFNKGNGVTYAGFVNNEDSAGALTGTLAYGGTSQGAVNSGGYTIIPSGLSAANYTITYHNGQLNITPAALTVTAKDTVKTYDATAFTGGNGVSYNGFITGEDHTILSGSLSYTGSSQGAVNTGNAYVITPGGYTAANYSISYVNGTLSINPKALTVTANDSARVYNGDVFAGGNGVTYSGFAGSESEAVLGGTLAYDGSAQGVAAVGLYEIEPKGLTAFNYAITYVKGALSITAAPLTITAIDSAKTYDATAFNGGNGVTYTGFVNGEDAAVLTGTLVYGGSAQGAVHAGNNYTIAPSGLTGHNYHITFNPGTLTINKAGLTITAIDSVKTYDGVAFSGGNGVSYTGFKGTDDNNVLTGTLGYGGDAQTARAAGNYDIIPKDVQAANYTITFVKGTLQITPAALTITAKDTSKTYDGNTFAGGNGVVYNGFVAGDNAGMLSGTLAYTGTSQGAVNAGNGYVITPSGLTAANYAITYVNGSLTIQKAGLTVTATDTVKTYNGIAFSGGNGVTYNGFVSGDNAGMLTGTLTYTGSSQGAVNTGSNYVIAPSGLAAANYVITYVNGALDITRAALTVKAKDTTKVYDAIAFSGGNEVTYTGFVNNESAAVLTGSLLYGGSSQGAINVGNSYVIEPSGLQAANYTITYVNGNLSVTQSTLEVEALNDTVTYSGLSYTGGRGVHITGFKGTDNAQVLGGSLTYSGTAQGAVNAGVYEIVPGGYTSGNYLIQYAKGALRIDKAPLTVTADNKQRCFGLANPAFTVGYTGWVNGEGIAALSTQATANTSATTASVAGAYAIVPLGAAAANYAITYVNGSLTVYALPVSTLSAVNGSVLCGSNGSLPLIASAGYNYQWLLNNNALAGGEAGTFTATQTGRYTAIVTDANNCTAAAANSITVTRLLPATVAFNFDSYCAGKAVTFTNTSDAGASGAVSYMWNSGNGQTGNNKDARFTYATAGTYTAALTVTPVVCPSLAVTVTKNISIEAPVPGIRLETVNTTAGLPTQVAARNLSDAAYTWLPATGLSNAYIYNPIVTIDEDREYQIQMDFPSGCTTTDNLRVTAFVQNTILVANVFTPNGDGQNDLLIANLRGLKQLRYFRVFNRAGKKLFETADAGQGWDGRYNGELQPLATYIWTAEAVDVNGRTIHRQGSVTLLR